MCFIIHVQYIRIPYSSFYNHFKKKQRLTQIALVDTALLKQGVAVGNMKRKELHVKQESHLADLKISLLFCGQM